jgi:CheY-like chemotaxis protein
MMNPLTFQNQYNFSGSFSWMSYNPQTYKKLIDKIPDWSMKNILIVEDDDTNAYLLKAYLKKTGATLILVKDGQKAVDVCNSALEIDLVLMDIRLPVMNGFIATQRIKESRKDLPVIAQTAFTQNSDVTSAFEAGCDDFLPKPIAQEQLFSVLSKYLR